MNARERLEAMVRTDRGDMNVYSEPEVRDALDAYTAQVLREAARLMEATGRDDDAVNFLDLLASRAESKG
ncbi:hypothetical protein [Streptomyces prasinopilosus]|uniref:hypothetical protein n=1 Tax=Streptomyces prasinopilosus TaxID=67344 RepID=UPI0006EB9235|nr:hypothetical protein [Streptomyces prasinopilosus]